jgi:hypothetical protein
MADKIKSVSVVFQAFTDKFEKKVDKAGNKMGGFVKKAAGFAAGFLVARASIDKVTQAMGDLDKLGKLSDSLEIDPNTLRGLDLAATQTGTSFEVMTKGIQRMVQTIGEARSGMSTGKLALDELGMSAKDFEGLDAEAQFMKMADAIAAIEDPAQKAAAANKLFGRSGKELLNVLNQGSAGIREFIRQAEEIGGPISRKDSEKVEEANDAIDKMDRLFDGIFQSIAINISPAITDMALGIQALKPLVDEFADAWKSVQNEIEDIFTLLIGGQDAFNIELGGSSNTIKKAQTKTNLPTAIAPIVTKGFANAFQHQSSKTFDILNPAKPNSIAGKNAAANETTAKNTSKMNTLISKLAGNNFNRVRVP